MVSPVLNFLQAFLIPITAGIPSSLATIEAWDKIPPCSTTIPLDKAIKDVHPGSVRLVIKTSKLPFSGIENSSKTTALPVTLPLDAPIPEFD